MSEFKQRCLEIVRDVERTGRSVAITRRGRVVARLAPSSAPADKTLKPWEALRLLGGTADIEPSESVLRDEDFEALR